MNIFLGSRIVIEQDQTTVGTAFGGIVEVGMRSDAASVYAQIQPTEGVELIEQLAAGLGH